MQVDDPARSYRRVEEFTLADLESLRNVLRGGSVIDWHRLNFQTDEDLLDFVRVHEFDPSLPDDLERMESIKREAIEYLRRNFDFPVPRSVHAATAMDLFKLASSKGHKQVCACIILKVMHIIHHLQGRELLFMLPLSDAEVFHLVEEKIYRVVGEMLTGSLPIVEFLGGRKNKDSLYTKLLSKTETIAAQIYDKLRFRIVTRSKSDLFPVLNYLTRRLFPFNYVIPSESKNTLVDFRTYCARSPMLSSLLPHAQGGGDDEGLSAAVDNKFSAKNYRVVHFVVDMPVRVPDAVLKAAPPTARPLGPVVFVLTEFQVVDQQTDQHNEQGDASHARYKERQRMAVMERLRMGFRSAAEQAKRAVPSDEPTMEVAIAPPASPAEVSASRRIRTSRPPRR